MIFIHEPDRYLIKIYWMCKNELSTSKLSKVSYRIIYIWTDIQTYFHRNCYHAASPEVTTAATYYAYMSDEAQPIYNGLIHKVLKIIAENSVFCLLRNCVLFRCSALSAALCRMFTNHVIYIIMTCKRSPLNNWRLRGIGQPPYQH